MIDDFITFLHKNDCSLRQSDDIYPGCESLLIAQSGDKPTRKTLYVSLSDDGSFGRYYNCKTGDAGFWHRSAGAGEYVDKAERKRLEAQAKARHEAERAKAAKAAAEAAAEVWLFSQSDTTGHPYLRRKGVSGHGIALAEGDLLIPMRHSIGGDLIGIQSITPEGDKYFGTGVAKKGAFHLIGTVGDVLYICEGYATAATVHEATGDASVVAFDAGNLKPVTQYMRRQFPDAMIVIAGDNDHKTDGNPGIKYGQQAALVAGGSCWYPVDLTGTDWNDYAAEFGIDKVTEILTNKIVEAREAQSQAAIDIAPGEASVPIAPASQAVSGGDLIPWAASLIPKGFDKDGNVILDPRSMHNGITLIKNLPKLKGLFRYNEFKNDVFVCRCPPWDRPEEFKVRILENVDLTRLEAYLEVSDGMRLGSDKLLRCIEDVAMQDRFHPVRDYFNELQWDGKPRLATHFQRCLKVTEEPPEYLARIATMWFVAGVARVFEPGCKFDNMLVLEGKQDYGKSLWLRTIGTFGRDIEECYYTDAITIDMIEERGSILKLQGNLIIEFPELSGMGKKDQDQIKRWITLQWDEVEVKYRQRTQVMQRQFILAGTYNPIQGEGWLNDPTGGRRFWPVTVGGFVDVEGVRAEREQLWAEAVHIYRQGYTLYIDKSDPVYLMAQQAQAQRATVDIWHDAVAKIVSEGPFWSSSEILDKLGLPVAKQGMMEKRRVSKVMSQLGWEYKERSINGSRMRVWCKTQAQRSLLEDAEEVRW